MREHSAILSRGIPAGFGMSASVLITVILSRFVGT